MNTDDLQAQVLARQTSDVQLEEKIQPAGKIENIKKNKHQKMLSNVSPNPEPFPATA